ncbi:MAG TPA: DinB family protein [Pyrinomonadaceae bacterium]|nr:DinB family protein [Pyrinomonadaceae bacterium]
MKEISVSEAFASNDRVHEKLVALVGSLTDDQLATRDVSQDKWSVSEVVEHISIVEAGIAGLCSKLLQRAKENGATSDGKIRLSDHFLLEGDKSMAEKWQAPDRVRPTGTKTIQDSFALMADTRAKLEELRPLFEDFSSSDSSFPHPFLGDLTAAEWLCLIGGHGVRHMRQIKRILKPVAE